MVTRTLVLVLALLSLALSQGYQRSAWPHWSGNCPDTRQQVLIEESRRPVTMSADGCRVLAGEWLDPYDGELLTSPAVIDVDHMIPLQFAHRAGGWRWTRARKAAYANALDNPDHLVAVTARANDDAAGASAGNTGCPGL